MPVIEKQFRRQRAILWTAATADDYGETRVNPPVEIDCRWNESQSEGLDAEGNVIAIDAKVLVGMDIAPGSLMWLGSLEDLPAQPSNLKRVVAFSSTPDIKGREVVRSVSLVRYSDSLPAVVS